MRVHSASHSSMLCEVMTTVWPAARARALSQWPHRVRGPLARVARTGRAVKQAVHARVQTRTKMRPASFVRLRGKFCSADPGAGWCAGDPEVP